MLCSIYIENILLIERTTIDFQDGFSVITGQTGAGKSIIFDAISLVLGERLRQKVVPDGKVGTIVATFEISKNATLLQTLAENGIHVPDNILILRRNITDSGISKIYLCDIPCSSALVSKISELLIEIYNQNGSLRHKNSTSWIEILDRYINDNVSLSAIQSIYKQRQDVLNQIAKLQTEQKSLDVNRMHLEQIIKDVNALDLKDNEEGELNDLKNNNKASFEASKYFLQALEIIDTHRIPALLNKLDLTLQKIDTSSSSTLAIKVQDLQKICEKASLELGFVRDEISDIAGENSSHAALLEKIEERLYAIKSVARKHNLLPGALKKACEDAKLKIEQYLDTSKLLNQLIKEEDNLRTKIIDLSKRISSKRRIAADMFVSEINKQLEELMLHNAKLDISIETSEDFINPSGIDRVKFLASLNPGTPMGDLEKIASGGELSRLMLAIQVVIAKENKRGTILFDEIDTGISGSIAGAIGRKMRRIADYCQIISITHNHQVAACAQNHLHISKSLSEGRVMIVVENLSLDARISMLAEMMSNSSESDVNLKEAARRMISEP